MSEAMNTTPPTDEPLIFGTLWKQWLRSAALVELVRLSEDLGLYDELPHRRPLEQQQE